MKEEKIMKSMKRRILLLVAAIMLMTFILPLAAFAEGETVNGVVDGEYPFKWMYNTSTATMTIEAKGAVDASQASYEDTDPFVKYVKQAKKLVFSEGITKVCGSFMPYNNKLVRIVFPSTLKTIETYAFGECNYLTTVNFPANLTSIGHAAFLNANLKSIKLPAKLKSIGGYALSSTTVKSIKLPKTLSSIGEGAFSGIMALSKITIESGNKYFVMSGGALYNKAKTRLVWVSPLKTGKYTIAAKVTNASGAFSELSKITEIVINAKLKADDMLYDIQNMRYLKKITVNSKNKTCTSADGVLYNKNKTKLLAYPAAKSGDYTMPSTVKTMDEDAIFNARNMKSILLSKSFAYKKGEYSYPLFPNSKNFKTIRVASANKTLAASYGMLYNKAKTKLYVCPEGQSGAVKVRNGAKSIAEGAFADCRYITSVTMPSTVTSVGDGAFEGCIRLEKVKLSANIKKITSGMFYGDKRLTSVTLPTALTSIEMSAFEECTALTKLTIPANVKSIEPTAFWGCKKLSTITVSKNNKYLRFKDGAFYNVSGTVLKFYLENKQKTIKIADGVKTIPEGALVNCTSCEEIVIPASVEKISAGALAYRYGAYGESATLKKVTFEGDCPEFEMMGMNEKDDGTIVYVIYEFALQDGTVEIVYNKGAAGFDKYSFENANLTEVEGETEMPEPTPADDAA